jgi:hypothetical protein
LRFPSLVDHDAGVPFPRLSTLAIPCICTLSGTAASVDGCALGPADSTLQSNDLVAQASPTLRGDLSIANVDQGPGLWLWRREIQPYGCNRRRVLRRRSGPSALPPLIGLVAHDGSH